jgi:hypothetical protein
MNFALPSAGPARARMRFLAPLSPATLGWFVACVAAVAVAAASVPAVGWAADIASTFSMTRVPPAAAVQPAAAPDLTEGLSPRLTARCLNCGIVETVRALEVTGAAPVGYELTVRLRDGSRRTSSDSGRWRVGDSIMLLGGTGLGDRV